MIWQNVYTHHTVLFWRKATLSLAYCNYCSIVARRLYDVDKATATRMTYPDVTSERIVSDVTFSIRR